MVLRDKLPELLDGEKKLISNYLINVRIPYEKYLNKINFLQKQLNSLYLLSSCKRSLIKLIDYF